MGAPDPRETASHLRRLLSTPPAFAQLFLRQSQPSSAIDDLLSCVGPRWQQLAQIKPLCHNMTNTVVQNFAANVALALGASPIMSLNSAEASDLAAVSTSALVLNMGTLTHDALHHYKTALAAYNVVGRPTLFDPVGGGATAIRRQAVRDVLDVGHFDVIKGNEAEIRTVWRQGAGNHVATAESEEDIKQHGVDSGCKMLDEHSAARLVRDLARRERTVVLMTGETDFISDGSRCRYQPLCNVGFANPSLQPTWYAMDTSILAQSLEVVVLWEPLSLPSLLLTVSSPRGVRVSQRAIAYSRLWQA